MNRTVTVRSLTEKPLVAKSSIRFIKRAFALLTLTASALLGGNAQASTYTWNSSSGGTWSTNTNWSPATVPTFVAGDTFDLSQLNITANETSTMSAAITLGNINIGDTNNTNTWTLATGGFLTLNSGGSGAATITQVAGSAGDTISGAYSVASNLNLVNNSTTNGTLTISGLGTINASNLTLTQSGTSSTGIVALSGGLSFNSASGTTFATSGTTAAKTQIGGITFASGTSAMTLSGSAFTLTGGITNSSTTNLETINNNLTLSNTSFTFTTAAGGLTLNGNISTGTGINGNLTLGSGAGTTILAGTNSIISTASFGGVAALTRLRAIR